jgi:hypothetical protein
MNTRQFLSSLSIITLFALSLGSCEESLTFIVTVPGCIESKIKAELKSDSPPTEVWEWKVDQKIYYYFVASCCDQFNYLYDNNCELICAPDGGFSGAGDGQCPEFPASMERTLVWKK